MICSANRRPPVYRASANTAQVAAGTTTATGPTVTGLASGDLMLTVICLQSTADTMATPTGWTLVHGPTDSTLTSGNGRFYLFRRTATLGADDTPTWTKTGTGGAWRVMCHAVRATSGIDTSTPAALAGAADQVPIAAAITPTVLGTQVFGIIANRNGANTGAASGYTERADSGGVAPASAIYTRDVTPSPTSSTGTATYSTGSACKWCCYTIALKPAV